MGSRLSRGWRCKEGPWGCCGGWGKQRPRFPGCSCNGRQEALHLTGQGIPGGRGRGEGVPGVRSEMTKDSLGDVCEGALLSILARVRPSQVNYWGQVGLA